MRDRLLKQASREFGPGQRLAVLVVAGVLFVIILPLAIIGLGGRLAHALINAIIGGLVFVSSDQWNWVPEACCCQKIEATRSTEEG